MIYHTRIQSHHQSLIAKTWRCKWMITNVATILTHPTLQLFSLHSSNDFECRVFLDIPTSWVVRYQYRLPKHQWNVQHEDVPGWCSPLWSVLLEPARTVVFHWILSHWWPWTSVRVEFVWSCNFWDSIYECFHCWSVFYCPCSEARKFPTLAEPKCLLHAIVSGQHLLPATSSVQFGVLTTSGLIMSVKSMRSVTARTSSSSEQCLPKLQDAQLKHFSKHCWNQ